MRTIFDHERQQEILTRIGSVGSEMRPRWGTLNAERMLAHLHESLRMALGEIHPKPKKLPIRFTPLKQLIIYWLPFPKGAPTAPELLSAPVADLTARKESLARLLDELVRRADQQNWPDHPAFGRLSCQGWGVLVYRHFDHHLRQFGC